MLLVVVICLLPEVGARPCEQNSNICIQSLDKLDSDFWAFDGGHRARHRQENIGSFSLPNMFGTAHIIVNTHDTGITFHGVKRSLNSNCEYHARFSLHLCRQCIRHTDDYNSLDINSRRFHHSSSIIVFVTHHTGRLFDFSPSTREYQVPVDAIPNKAHTRSTLNSNAY